MNSIKCDASGSAKRGCSRNQLRTFLMHTSISKKCPGKMITHTFLLSFHHDITKNSLALFLFNVTVQCVNDENFLSMHLSQSVKEKYGACAPDWRTSFNNTSHDAS